MTPESPTPWRGAAMALLVLSFLWPPAHGGAAEAVDEEFRPLFNGKDLAGWVVVNTAPSTWRFEDGMLVCSGKPIGEIRTDRMFQNFILELEWRHMVPRGNAGIFIWADDITARGQPFHRGIEVQVLENEYGNTQSHTTHGDIFPIHGATMDPVTGHKRGSRAFPTENRSNPSPEWNHYRIECVDGKISLAVNGKVVTRGENCSPRKGYICIESEGGIVHYRNVRIKELPDSPISPDDVAIANRGYRCLYTGVDLSGWKQEGAEGWESRDWRLAFERKKAQGEAGRLVSDQVFGDIGFIFDVAPTAESGVPRVLIRGSERAAIAVDLEDEKMAPHFEKAGKWNRFEGTLRGDRLSLSLNGVSILEDARVAGVPEKGPIVLESGGPVQWANIYVRALDFPGARSDFHGFERCDFTFRDRAATVVAPEKAAPGNPWIWRARFFGQEPQADIALLAAGFHIAYADVAGLFGSPEAVAHWDAFYAEMTGKYGFAPRVALEGMSRGGLIVYNWAIANPGKVTCIYADAPVCDIRSWPAGMGAGKGSEKTWAQCLEAYGMTEEEVKEYRGGPLENLEPLARARVPLLHVVGDADEAVPVSENTTILEERYRKLGGDIEVIHKPGGGHHPHSLEDPAPIVDFILKHTGVAR